MRKRRYRNFGHGELLLDDRHRKLGGVCAGVARYLDISRLLVRIIALAGLVVAPQAMLIAYGLAYLILDRRSAGEDRFDRYSAEEEY